MPVEQHQWTALLNQTQELVQQVCVFLSLLVAGGRAAGAPSHWRHAAMAAHANGQTLDLRQDHLVLAVRVGRPPALQGRLSARHARIQKPVCLGWQVSASQNTAASPSAQA